MCTVRIYLYIVVHTCIVGMMEQHNQHYSRDTFVLYVSNHNITMYIHIVQILKARRTDQHFWDEELDKVTIECAIHLKCDFCHHGTANATALSLPSFTLSIDIFSAATDFLPVFESLHSQTRSRIVIFIATKNQYITFKSSAIRLFAVRLS